MKIAFISDIHGNAVALDAVLKDIKEKGIEAIYVLGDICYRGPEPKRSLQLVQSLQTKVIKGNADEWVVRGVHKGEVPDKALELMNLERDWTAAQLDAEDMAYLQSLPEQLTITEKGMTIHAFHATPVSLFDVVLPGEPDEGLEEKLISHQNADILIYAHIHKPYIRYIKGKAIMNIGSVGLPFDGLRKASYGIVEIEEGHVQTSIVRVETDVEKVVSQFKAADYPNLRMIDVVQNASL